MTDKRAAEIAAGLRPIERRVLAYLDQRGPTHRARMAADLSPDDSRTARFQNGSNGAVPLIVGAWCKRMKAAGLVHERREYGTDAYMHHEITGDGRKALRAHLTNPENSNVR